MRHPKLSEWPKAGPAGLLTLVLYALSGCGSTNQSSEQASPPVDQKLTAGINVDPKHLMTFGQLKAALQSQPAAARSEFEGVLVENDSTATWRIRVWRTSGWGEEEMWASFADWPIKDGDVLKEIRVGRGFRGSICGIRIGDGRDVMAALAKRQGADSSELTGRQLRLYEYSPEIPRDWKLGDGWVLFWTEDDYQGVFSMQLKDIGGHLEKVAGKWRVMGSDPTERFFDRLDRFDRNLDLDRPETDLLALGPDVVAVQKPEHFLPNPLRSLRGQRVETGREASEARSAAKFLRGLPIPPSGREGDSPRLLQARNELAEAASERAAAFEAVTKANESNWPRSAELAWKHYRRFSELRESSRSARMALGRPYKSQP